MGKVFRKAYRSFSKLISSKNYFLIRSLPFLYRKRRLPLERLDYIRVSSLELAAEEIYKKNIAGNVAELGVYQGEFAKDINLVFADRSLYLFDTFEGFDERDVLSEVKHAYSTGSQDFSGTSVSLVLEKMPYPEMCIIKKGFFPDTAFQLEEQFCFVSIDADLYEPILAGLNYFYPRLSKGGYIFIHDYNNNEYVGASKAVNEFCLQHNCGFVPVADIGGTAIICK